jgi:hypothetical protein
MLASVWKAGADIQEPRTASRCTSAEATAQHGRVQIIVIVQSDSDVRQRARVSAVRSTAWFADSVIS